MNTILGSSVFRGGLAAQPVRLCKRCGIPRKPGGRNGPLCADCRQVDPKWGMRDERRR